MGEGRGASEKGGGLPRGGTVGEPAHAVAGASGGRAFSGDRVDGVVRGRACRKGPGEVRRVRRYVASVGDGTDTATDGQADVDVGGRGSRGVADRKTGEDKDGEVVNTDRTGSTKGGSGKCGR